VLLRASYAPLGLLTLPYIAYSGLSRYDSPTPLLSLNLNRPPLMIMSLNKLLPPEQESLK